MDFEGEKVIFPDAITRFVKKIDPVE